MLPFKPQQGQKGGRKEKVDSNLKTYIIIIIPDHTQEGSVTNQHPERKMLPALEVVVTSSSLKKEHWVKSSP